MNKFEEVGAKWPPILIIFILGIVFNCGCIDQSEDVISVSGANALQPMMEIWAKEYQKLHPDIKIIVVGGGAGKGMTEALTKTVDIGMVSRDIRKEEIDQGAFWISVAKDAVIGTINENNPAKEAILSKGMTRDELAEIFTRYSSDRTIKTWGQLIGDDSLKDDIIVFTRQDACGAAEMWAKYLGDDYKQDNLTNAADVAVIEDAPLRDAISSNQFAIGYNNINTIYSLETNLPYPGIMPIPLDLDENGKIDQKESFYVNSSEIVHAISNNVYPSPPARDLHLVTKDKFSGISRDFVYWILTDGQQYVTSSGYVRLPERTIDQQLGYLSSGTRPETI